MVGYCRCSTDEQDLTAKKRCTGSFGIEPSRIYVDRGLSGRNRNRPGLREALAACRDGDTFVATKLDRLTCSVRDAHEVADALAEREIQPSIGGSIHDPTGLTGKLLFNALAMIAEFEADVIRSRTGEGTTLNRLPRHPNMQSRKGQFSCRSSSDPMTCLNETAGGVRSIKERTPPAEACSGTLRVRSAARVARPP